MRHGRIRTLTVLLLAIGIAGCASAPLKFQRADSDEIVAWAQQWYAGEKVYFEPNGLLRVGDKLYLFGAFTTAAAAVRSFVLRSEDEGRTWTEVGHPVRGSEVLAMSFPDPTIGWALIGWVTEGPGEISTQRTGDGGLTWKRMPVVPKDHYSGWPVAFAFSDPAQGVLVLQYMDDNPERMRPLYVTRDGGQTWKGYYAPEESETGRVELAAFEDTAPDGSTIRLAPAGETWVLTRQAASGVETLFTFPERVLLSDVVSLEVNDCNCPGGKVRGRMLQ